MCYIALITHKAEKAFYEYVNKKMFLILSSITLLTFGAASANETVTLWSSSNDHLNEVSPRFQINADLARAWVQIRVRDLGYLDMGEKSFQNIVVPGMSFDASTQEIRYEKEGNIFICATKENRGRGIFRRTNLVSTGECVLNVKRVNRLVNDGFYQVSKTFVEVELTLTTKN